MPRVHHRRLGSDAEEVNAGRRHLSAIDPAVLRRVVGRPTPQDAEAEAHARAAGVPAHRRNR